MRNKNKSQQSDQELLLYSRYADWWPLLSAPEEYEEDAQLYHEIISEHCSYTPKTMLELGSGGGNTASHLTKHYNITLCDISEHMLNVSKKCNPTCPHVCGDMRTVRLAKQYDVVLIHDAIGYMNTKQDLQAAIKTAFLHCKPGGISILIPDYTTETFRPATYHGGHDGEEHSMRFLQWDHDPTPRDGQYQIDFVYLFHRNNQPSPECVAETHTCGLFKTKEWLSWMKKAGFKACCETIETEELVSGQYKVFVGKKSA